MVELEDSYLIQRLSTPPRKTGSPLDKAHRVFGGGMMGLSEQAWDALDELFTVDYMGAAEFEFGTLPKVMRRIIEGREFFIANSLVLKKREISNHWKRRTSKDVLPEKVDRRVYYLCHKEIAELVPNRLRQLAKNKISTKCGHYFDTALDPIYEGDSNTVGWLDLTNHFFFFTDENMFKAVAKSLGIEVTEDILKNNPKRKRARRGAVVPKTRSSNTKV